MSRSVQRVQELQLDVQYHIGAGTRRCDSLKADVGEAAQQVPAAFQRYAGSHGSVAQHVQIPQSHHQ